MRFSCSLPIEGSFQSVQAIADAARAIEAAGVDACFVTDHPAPSAEWLSQPQNGAHETLDPFVALTIAATVTSRLQLHTNIIVLPYRNPFIVAKSAASLDAVSGGRVILGVAVGYHQPEFDTLGVPFDQRGAITDEGIVVMRKAWTGEAVAHQGLHFNARDAVVRPRPARPEGIPIWGGGNSKRAIRRAVELCDGWSPFPAPAWVTTFAGTDELETLDQLRAKLVYLRDYAAEIGPHGADRDLHRPLRPERPAQPWRCGRRRSRDRRLRRACRSRRHLRRLPCRRGRTRRIRRECAVVRRGDHRQGPRSHRAGRGVMIGWTNYGLFVLASLVLILVPGPDMLFMLGRSIAQGRRAGIVAAFGINAGGYVHLAAAITGLSAILLTSALAFTIVKWAGAAYLIYLGDQRPARPRRCDQPGDRRGRAAAPARDLRPGLSQRRAEPEGRGLLPRAAAAVRRSQGRPSGCAAAVARR